MLIRFVIYYKKEGIANRDTLPFFNTFTLEGKGILYAIYLGLQLDHQCHTIDLQF